MDRFQALSAKQQSIIPIAAFTANGDLDKLKIALQEGLAAADSYSST
jgi:4-carboxymuconolactone decarboxylase